MADGGVVDDEDIDDDGFVDGGINDGLHRLQGTCTNAQKRGNYVLVSQSQQLYLGSSCTFVATCFSLIHFVTSPLYYKTLNKHHERFVYGSGD